MDDEFSDHAFTPLGIWHDDEYAVIIMDDEEGEGRAIIEELTRAKSLYMMNYIIGQALTLYSLVGPQVNLTREGKPHTVIVDKLERFSEPIPSFPKDQFVMCTTREWGEAHPDIPEISPEDAVLMEAGALLSRLRAEGLPDDPEELTYETEAENQ